MNRLNNKPTQRLKLAPFFRSLADTYEIHLYAQMFREDVALAIMPIGGTSRRHPNFTAQLTGSDSDKALEFLRSFNGGRQQSINQIACKTIDKLVKDLMWRGSSLYEIFEQEGKPNIIYISGERTFSLPWFTVQLVPKSDQAEWERRYSIAKDSNIWKISIPESLGGRRKYRQAIKTLNSMTSGAMPEFARMDLSSGKSSSFDVGEYNLMQTRAINKATEAWNWHRREMFSDKQTEYYTAYKRAKFRFGQALLREHLIVEINRLFTILNLTCQLSVSGIPTSSEIASILIRLEKGEINFNDVYDKTSV